MVNDRDGVFRELNMSTKRCFAESPCICSTTLHDIFTFSHEVAAHIKLLHELSWRKFDV